QCLKSKMSGFPVGLLKGSHLVICFIGTVIFFVCLTLQSGEISDKIFVTKDSRYIAVPGTITKNGMCCGMPL
ncbi:hypothetical protein OFC53_36390, partial [Escherichia coli]|nr:hypothetical protein [Escherichia coli]